MVTLMADGGVDLLAVGPHPDDVELFCGGILIRMADLGHTTAVLDLTEGERASNGDVATRRAEAAAAAKVLGLSVRENLGLPDTWLSPWSGHDLEAPDRLARSQVVRVVEAIRRLKPELVLIPWSEARHPDHSAASELLTKALFFAHVARFETPAALAPHRVRRVLYYAQRHTMSPTFVVDTTEAAERKREAIACYASQVARPATPTLVGAPGALDALDARDRYFGSMIGVAHGEPLRVVEVLGIDDPVEHFRRHDYPHAFVIEGRR